MIPVRCLVVDDEPLAREIVETHLRKIPGWKLVGSCINAEEAYDALLMTEVDVIFLDIQMPIISGVDFLRSLKKPPLVVFTTAYNQYAVEGFNLNVVDYLIKPITLDRFFQAVEKVKECLTAKNVSSEETKESSSSYFFVKNNGKLLKINFRDILYIKAEKDFSSVYLNEKKLLVGMHLKLLEKLLPDELFTRVHRSYIAHHARISSIYGNILHIEGNEIPIGANFKDDLYRKLRIS